MEPEPEVPGGAGAPPRDPDDLEVAFLPLMTADRQLLPLHFLTQGEVRASQCCHGGCCFWTALYRPSALRT